MCVICVCVFELGLLCGLLDLQMVSFVCLSVSLMVWWLLLLLLIIPHREHCINITYTHCSTLYLLLRLIFYTSYISSYSFRILWEILKIIGCNLKHTPRLTHTQKEMLIIFASFIIKQVLFMWMPKNCQANENEWLSFEGKKQNQALCESRPVPF